MESLALIAALIVLSIIVLGVLAAVVVLRPPGSTAGRVLVSVPAGAALVSGAWFAFLDIGSGARVLGAVVALVAVAALVRTWRGR
ncbi:MAG: hypothetical protein ACO3RB_08385 [Ilumatobacteraceae bacterium]